MYYYYYIMLKSADCTLHMHVMGCILLFPLILKTKDLECNPIALLIKKVWSSLNKSLKSKTEYLGHHHVICIYI